MRAGSRWRMMSGSISTATSSNTPMNAGTAPAGREKCACTSIGSPLIIRHAGDRHALAQHLVDEDGQQRAEEAAEHAAASAEDRGAADDDGRDDDQLGAETALRGCALVLRDGHQAGDGRAERGEEIGADAHPARRNAGVDRRQLVAACGERLVAPAGLGEHDGADRDDDQRERDLIVEAPGVELAELEEPVIVARLDRIEDRLAAGQPEDEAAADEEHRQRGDEGRHAQER